MILVSPPTAVTHLGRVKHHVEVDGTPEPTLYFDVPEDFAHMVSATMDHFALALLLPAMRSSQDLHLDGTITDELLFNLNGPVQAWIRSILPIYQQVHVTAGRVQAFGPGPAGVATGFSAGVDSYSLLGDYLFAPDVPFSLRVSHLLFNNVGSHDERHLARAAVQLGNVRRLSAGWGLPLLDVTSNLDAHLVPMGSHTAFHNTHTLRNASVAHFLGGGIGTWLYASEVPFADVHGRVSPYMGTSDPLSLPLLSTPTLRLRAVGHERTRVEKTIQVAGLKSARAGLTVCIDAEWAREINCSRCEKCLRTLLTLEIAGKLDAFCPRRFDRGVYLTHRESFMVKVLASAQPMHREIVEFAEAKGFRWPANVLRQARLRKGMQRSRATMRDARKLVQQRHRG